MNPTPPSDEHPILAELKNPRRMFHQRPEIGFHEFWTTARICEYLSRLNCTLFYGDGLYRDFPEPELLSVWKDKIADNAANIIVDRFLVSGSEDATFIMNEVLRSGGLATYIGLCSPTYGGHHNETFDLDEDLPMRGVRLLYQLANNLMGQSRMKI